MNRKKVLNCKTIHPCTNQNYLSYSYDTQAILWKTPFHEGLWVGLPGHRETTDVTSLWPHASMAEGTTLCGGTQTH